MTYSFKILTFLAEVTAFYLEQPRVVFWALICRQTIHEALALYA